MDTQMPGLSGLALIRALREECKTHNAVRAGTRILAISASPVGEEIHQAADGFLLKPLEVDELLNLLELQPAKVETAIDSSLVRSSSDAAQATADYEPDSELFIDPVVLGKYQAMMPDAAVREIYVALSTDLHPRLAQLSEAMEAGDAAEVKRIAHAIKGSCGMFGLKSAAAAAARLETNATGAASNGPDTYSAELIRLYAALHALDVILGGDFPVRVKT
jgi:HPt (histidine-containing phosphotransfer) domain-containing protein